MRVYSDNPGACIEPGGYEVTGYTYYIDCERCGADAIRRDWETLDGGCINPHWRIWCTHCGAKDESMFAPDGDDLWREVDYDQDSCDDGEVALVKEQLAYEQSVERFGYAVAEYACKAGRPRSFVDRETAVVTPQFKFWSQILLDFRLHYLPF